MYLLFFAKALATGGDVSDATPESVSQLRKDVLALAQTHAAKAKK